MTGFLGGLGVGDCDMDRQRRLWHGRPSSSVRIIDSYLFAFFDQRQRYWLDGIGGQGTLACAGRTQCQSTALVRSAEMHRTLSVVFLLSPCPCSCVPSDVLIIIVLAKHTKLQRDLRPSGFGEDSHRLTAVFTTRTIMSSAVSAGS
jgi:hypothetical protein